MQAASFQARFAATCCVVRALEIEAMARTVAAAGRRALAQVKLAAPVERLFRSTEMLRVAFVASRNVALTIGGR